MQPQMQAGAQLGTASNEALALRQNRVLRNTYLLLALSLIPTVIGAFVGVNSNFSFLRSAPVAGPLIMLAVMFGCLFGVSKLRNSGWGVALLLGFTFLMGWWLGPMLQMALGFSNGAQLIGMAAGGTSVIFVAMAAIGMTTKRDISFLGKFLFIGLIVVVLAMLANLFFQLPALSLAVSAAAVFLFSVFILYDINRVVRGGETNYVMATVAIYLDIYNLFINLLNLLMVFSGQRE
jgi:FtsH-binding integral membrane protein